jgi:uncharacterized protein (TIGR02328 family)
MRLWHEDIINGLPRQQLLSQWRELLAIKRKIDICGTPNHILVNYVINLKLKEWQDYCTKVYNALITRGYKANKKIYNELMVAQISGQSDLSQYHDKCYLEICYYNLTEKYIRCGISVQEYVTLKKYFGGII